MAGIDEETARVASNSGPVAYDAMEPRIRDPVTIEQAKLRAEALSLVYGGDGTVVVPKSAE